MKVMFVHGVGFHESEDDLSDWVPHWAGWIQESARRAGFDFPMHNPFGADQQPGGGDDEGILYYEDIINAHDAPSGLDYVKVVSELLRSYAVTKTKEWFRRDRWLISDEMKFKARQVAAWACDDEMREELRRRVVESIHASNPDVVIAHSYGGLITYDACLFSDPDLMKGRYYVTMGTQIGNALLRSQFGGRQIPVRCKHWFNLYNPRDPVFVVPLDHIRAANFTHLEVRHDYGHDGAGYLGHPTTAEHAWRPIRSGRTWLNRTRSIRSFEAKATRPPNSRALLVGIDRYQDDSISSLQGCVNDTYLLSAALQESRIDPRHIRLLHNERATKDNLLADLEWLLGDVRPGDHRFLSFSGHGTQVPSLNIDGETDQLDEVLVTSDFDFTEQSGLRDKDFQRLYADLDPKCHFMVFLDCCHSGGMDRNGGPLVRTITAPADIEHQSKKWNKDLQMWEQDNLNKGLNPDFLPPNYVDKETKEDAEDIKAAYYGRSGSVRRIGRATELRDIPYQKYDELRARIDKLYSDTDKRENLLGPYLPLIFMACRENQKASEYVHGSVSYGAFTFALVQALRDHAGAGKSKRPTYGKLVQHATTKLKRLGYTQDPQLLANRAQRRTRVPFG